MALRDIVVIGASAGGVQALRSLAAQLPANFPATLCIVLHIGDHASQLPQLLSSCGPNPAMYAEAGQPLQHGRLVLAPPDRHLLVEGDRLQLNAGAKEHHTRPAIDPLFRSAALSCGPRVIGVVLTGCLDDGSAGVQAIRDCGGLVVVQEPADADEPSMPLAALRAIGQPDHRVRLAELGALLAWLVQQPAPASALQPGSWEQEQRASRSGMQALEVLHAIGEPTALVCPECQGGIFEIKGSRPPRYRCHTGHAFSLRSMSQAQDTATEEALWAAVRALQDKSVVLARLAELDHLAGDEERAASEQAEAERVARQADALRELAQAQRQVPQEWQHAN